MRILVLSFYFPPDLCAGSFRVGPIVDALAAHAPVGAAIDVLTTLPNRYATFSADAPEREQRRAVTIRRIPLPSHRSGMADQSRAFLAFARAALRETRRERYDVVFATSSRLMTAVLGALVARRTGARLYLDIRDIFVDTIREVASRPMALLTVLPFSLLERWAVRRADRVNLVSRGFEPYFMHRYPGQRFSFHTNGIDPEFAAVAPLARYAADGAPMRIVYAGNIGEGQGLHSIVPALAERLRGRAEIQIIGEGGRRAMLEQRVAAAGVGNVKFVPPLRREALLERYAAADVLFVHLNDYDAFRKVLPSKIFEYAALGKPILAGVAGYAAEFITREVSNAAVFPPCDADAALRGLASLRITDEPRADFVRRFDRVTISGEIARDVLRVAEGTR